MGIKGLTALLSANAPNSIKEHDIKTLFGRKVAIDASMSIYQFLIAVRQRDGEMLTNDAGETTSHLMGFFYRTIRIVENGIKPCYVFDGKPPEMKKALLGKRFERRKEAEEGGEEAKEVGTAEDIDRFARRTVKVTREHNEECRRLLGLMGIPVVIAPSEAEAQCAELARGGKVYAAGSEDMDTLTFGTPILFRHLTFSEAKKAPISEINLKAALEGLDMTMGQFTDLCILLGCDYLEPIRGVGPTTALKLIREHGDLASIISNLRAKQKEKEAAVQPSDDEASEPELEPESEGDEPAPTSDIEETGITPHPSSDVDVDMAAAEESDGEHAPSSSPEKSKAKGKGKTQPNGSKKGKAKGKGKEDADGKTKPKAKGKGKGKGGIQVPEDYPWEEAKQMFVKPEVTPADEIQLDWNNPDVDGLVQFLVTEKGFNEERVRKGAEKLTKYLNTKQQGRLDGFFTVKPKEKAAASKGAAAKGKGAKGKDDPKAKGVKRKGDDKAASGSASKKKAKK
ncbi:hypothetical protein HGRIS_006136 [Hohenbuehelia grisea]|uniref:Flap endonuclease 1 n=1 Tax=Hohenbuehelia grisea TaxID=104357 RepID=A0ABR3JZX5_9AGAR